MNELVNYLANLGQSSELQQLTNIELAEHLIDLGFSEQHINAFIAGDTQELEQLTNTRSVICHIVHNPDDVPDEGEDSEDAPSDNEEKSLRVG